MLVDSTSWKLNEELFGDDAPVATRRAFARDVEDIVMAVNSGGATQTPPQSPANGADKDSIFSNSSVFRPSTASSILELGQQLAHVLCSTSCTDTLGNAIPLGNLQAVDVLVLDYHVLAIGAPLVGEDAEGGNLDVVAEMDVPVYFQMGPSRRPSSSSSSAAHAAPGLRVLAEGFEQQPGGVHGSGGGMMDEERPWREVFVACLRYDNTIRDARGKRVVKVVWDFDEMMRGVEGEVVEREERSGGYENVTSSQAFDEGLLMEQYEREARRWGTAREDQNCGGGEDEMTGLEAHIDPGTGFRDKGKAPVRDSYSSPEREQERQAAAEFWRRMERRDEAFQQEQARLRELESRPVFETWDMFKARKAREGREKRKVVKAKEEGRG